MNRRQRRVTGAIIIAILLLLLVKCVSDGSRELPNTGGTVEEVIRDDNQKILDQMKKDQKSLEELFLRGDVCSKEWAEDLLEVIDRMRSYEYSGDEEIIINLIASFRGYGDELEEVVFFIQDEDYEKAIEKLEEAAESAERVEKELRDGIEKVG